MKILHIFIICVLMMSCVGCASLQKFADDYGYYTQDDTVMPTAQTVGKAANILTGLVSGVEDNPVASIVGVVVSGLAAVWLGRRKKKRG